MPGSGTFCWNELLTSDPAAAVSFFSGLFGWTVEEMQMPERVYHVMKNGGAPVAGIMAFPPDLPAGVPPHWEAYVAVDDVDESVQAALQLGGKVMRPPWDIPNVGRLAIIQDPQGAVLSLMTPVPGS